MNGKGQPRRRFNIEAALAVVTAAIVVSTLINHQWIEGLTGWDPDKGNGSVEWAIVLVVASVALYRRARSDWRKLRTLGA